MNKNIRIGTSGGQADLKRFLACIESDNWNWEASVKHFSVGIRFFEAFDTALGERSSEHGITLSLHPVDINLSANLDMEEIRIFKHNLGNFPFDYLEEDLGLWRYEKIFLGAHQTDPGFSESSLHRAAHNAVIIQDLFEIPVVIENPPIYSGNIGMGFWEYYNRVCDLSGCQFAFDVGHYLGYCKIHNLPFDTPDIHSDIWKKIKTVHLSGMKYWRWNGIPVWLDQHADTYNQDMLCVTQICISNGEVLHNVLLEMEGANQSTRKQNFLSVENMLKDER